MRVSIHRGAAEIGGNCVELVTLDGVTIADPAYAAAGRLDSVAYPSGPVVRR
jgi:hypothetical protein